MCSATNEHGFVNFYTFSFITSLYFAIRDYDFWLIHNLTCIRKPMVYTLFLNCELEIVVPNVSKVPNVVPIVAKNNPNAVIIKQTFQAIKSGCLSSKSKTGANILKLCNG